MLINNNIKGTKYKRQLLFQTFKDRENQLAKEFEFRLVWINWICFLNMDLNRLHRRRKYLQRGRDDYANVNNKDISSRIYILPVNQNILLGIHLYRFSVIKN